MNNYRLHGFKKQITQIIFLATCSLLLAASGFAQEDASVIIKLIQEKTQAIQSYQASFTLKMQGPQGELLMSGNILFKRPDKIKMEITLPNIPNATQMTISDGNTMWQYIPFLRVASRVDLATLKKEFGEVYFTETKEDISKPLKEVEEGSIKYLGKEKIAGQEYFILEAKPKSQAQQDIPFTQVKVWVNTQTGLEKKTVFYDAEGKEVFSRDFETVVTNIEIEDAGFNFAPPEGVEVMDMTDETRRLIEAEKSGSSAPSATSLPADLPPPPRY